jgi:hypothetical protein
VWGFPTAVANSWSVLHGPESWVVEKLGWVEISTGSQENQGQTAEFLLCHATEQ